MTNLNQKIAAITTLFEGDAALLEGALKEALDIVEEYTDEATLKQRIVEASYQLRQLKQQKKTDSALFDDLKKEVLDTLKMVEKGPLSINLENAAVSIVCLKNIEKSYQSHNFTLKNVDLDFPLSQITGIIGANANGKSTLIKMMVGELLPNKGTIDFPFFQKTPKRLSWLELKQHIAYIPQELPDWHGSLRDNLHLETTLHGITGKENILRVDFILERLGLTEFTNRQWHELSGGYKLRFALAKALVWKPSCLVLDEPLANLDMASQMIVLQDLRELVKSQRFPLGIVVTSQHIHEIEQIADQLVVLEQGEIAYQGAPSAFKKDSQKLIFEFACPIEWSELSEILRGSPLLSTQRQGKYTIVQYDKKGYSVTQFFQFLNQNNIEPTYFRDITHSVKQLFLTA